MCSDAFQLHSLPRVVVLGAGIKGASVAANLAASGRVQIRVIEPFHAGSGISSTNHGRFHGGYWNHLLNSDEVIYRNRDSRKLVERLPEVWESSATGLYCIEDQKDVDAFRSHFDALRIPLRQAPNNARGTENEWIDRDRYTIFETPEASFNPASLADRLLRRAVATGKCKVVPGAAVGLARSGKGFVIRLSTGETVVADAVVNCMNGWMNTLKSDLDFWRPELVWSYWRLLCLNTHAVGRSPLDRVLTIDRKGAGPIAAVPHESWLIFGCDLTAVPMTSQDDIPPGEGWRPMDRRDIMDYTLWSSHAEHFPALKALAGRDSSRSIYSFAGVYPQLADGAATERLINGVPTPYNTATSWKCGDCSGYYPFFGGSATTALLDAQDLCAYLLEAHQLSASDKDEWIERIADQFPSKVAGKMIWENHRIACMALAA